MHDRNIQHGQVGRWLAPEHAALLASSGLHPDVIRSRGYWTAQASDADTLRFAGHNPDIVAHGPALMLPLHDVHGAVALTVARPDVPRLDSRGKPRKYEIPRGAKATLDVPPSVRAALGDPETRLWVVEGQKKADAAVSAGAGCAIALLGVWNWKKWAIPAWESVALRDRTVYLAFDSDARTNPKVADALRRLRAFVGSRGAHVRVVHLEPGPDGRKVGLDDALAAGATLDQLAASSTEHLRSLTPASDDRRPELDISILHRPVITAAFEHLAKAGVYKSAGSLVRVDNDDGALVLRSLKVPDVRAALDLTVRCVRRSDEGMLPCLPPRDLAELVAHDPVLPVPPLQAVVTSPTFTGDGRLIEEPGYDRPSRLLLALSWSPRPVPAEPTTEELAEARRWWDEEALADFPFASNADHTHALALALTPLVREMIAGPTPLFSAEAPIRGAGKGKMVATCLSPALGPRGVTVAALPREEEELRKAVTAYLAERRAAVVFDNVAGPIRSAVLAKALTDTVWDDRILGRSESVRYPVRCVWAITANNPTVSDEIARRLIPIRLVPQTDRPELRDGFRHPELEPWVNERRADLLWSLAVFVRAWQAAGRPVPAVRPLGSYEAWTRVIGGILEVAGYSSFLANRDEILEASDPDTAAWQAFVSGWWETHGHDLVGVRELLALAESHGVAVNGENERAQITSLGKALSARRDRFFGGWQLKQGAGRARREWRLRGSVTPRDTCDTSTPTLQRVAHACARARVRDENARLEVSHVSHVSPMDRAHQLTWEAEERLEREAIQGEAAA